MEKRPVFKIEMQLSDKVIEAIAYIALIALWLFICIIYFKLPETVPTHFDMSGTADSFGDKESVFMAPGICTVLFVMMSFIQHKPQWLNYPTEITPENALKQYTFAMKMIRFLKLSIVIIFGLIELHTYKAAMGMNAESGKYLIITVLALVYIPVFYFLIQSSKSQ